MNYFLYDNNGGSWGPYTKDQILALKKTQAPGSNFLVRTERGIPLSWEELNAPPSLKKEENTLVKTLKEAKKREFLFMGWWMISIFSCLFIAVLLKFSPLFLIIALIIISVSAYFYQIYILCHDFKKLQLPGSSLAKALIAFIFTPTFIALPIYVILRKKAPLLENTNYSFNMITAIFIGLFELFIVIILGTLLLTLHMAQHSLNI